MMMGHLAGSPLRPRLSAVWRNVFGVGSGRGNGWSVVGAPEFLGPSSGGAGTPRPRRHGVHQARQGVHLRRRAPPATSSHGRPPRRGQRRRRRRPRPHRSGASRGGYVPLDSSAPAGISRHGRDAPTASRPASTSGGPAPAPATLIVSSGWAAVTIWGGHAAGRRRRWGARIRSYRGNVADVENTFSPGDDPAVDNCGFQLEVGFLPKADASMMEQLVVCVKVLFGDGDRFLPTAVRSGRQAARGDRHAADSEHGIGEQGRRSRYGRGKRHGGGPFSTAFGGGHQGELQGCEDVMMHYNVDDDAYELSQMSEGCMSRLCGALDETVRPLRSHPLRVSRTQSCRACSWERRSD